MGHCCEKNWEIKIWWPYPFHWLPIEKQDVEEQEKVGLTHPKGEKEEVEEQEKDGRKTPLPA